MSLISGSMMTGNRRVAWAIGALVHFIVMGVVFGFIYAGLFAAFGISAAAAAWWVGGLIGLVHGLLVGTVMPMMPAMHPRMEPHPAEAGRPVHRPDQPAGLRLSAPGFMGREWGGMTPMGILVGRVVYGIVLGLIYALIV